LERGNIPASVGLVHLDLGDPETTARDHAIERRIYGFQRARLGADVARDRLAEQRSLVLAQPSEDLRRKRRPIAGLRAQALSVAAQSDSGGIDGRGEF